MFDNAFILMYYSVFDSWERIKACCPTSVHDIIGSGLYQPDALTDFFEDIKKRLDFKYWLFGHYHDNRIIGQKFILLYEQIIELE